MWDCLKRAGIVIGWQGSILLHVKTREERVEEECHPTHPPNSTGRKSNNAFSISISKENGVFSSRFFLSYFILPSPLCFVHIRISWVHIGGTGNRLDQGHDWKEREDGQESDFDCLTSVWQWFLGCATVVVDSCGAYCYRGWGAENWYLFSVCSFGCNHQVKLAEDSEYDQSQPKWLVYYSSRIPMGPGYERCPCMCLLSRIDQRERQVRSQMGYARYPRLLCLQHYLFGTERVRGVEMVLESCSNHV